MITSKNLKTLYKELESKRAQYLAAEELADANPSDKELEDLSDALYIQYWNAADEFAKAIEAFTSGQINSKTAWQLLMNKKEELTALFNRPFLSDLF